MRFNNASIQERRESFNSLGAKYILKDGILAIELYPWIQPLKNEVVSLTREYRKFETSKKAPLWEITMLKIKFFLNGSAIMKKGELFKILNEDTIKYLSNLWEELNNSENL